MARHRVAHRTRKARELAEATWQPDAKIDHLSQFMEIAKRHLKNGRPEDGVVAAPLQIAAKYAAHLVAEQQGFEVVDEAAFAHWLVGRWGEVINELDAFYEWRADNKIRAARSVAISN